MKNFKIFLFVLLFATSLVSSADSSLEFLKSFLEEEAKGARLERVNSALFAKEKYVCENDSDAKITEEFDMDINSLYVFKNYNIELIKTEKNISIYNVRFNNVIDFYYDCDVKVIDGSSRKIRWSSDTQDVVYKVQSLDGKFKILNPVKPFVYDYIYEDFLKSSLSQLEFAFSKTHSDRQLLYIEKYKAELEIFKSQDRKKYLPFPAVSK